MHQLVQNAIEAAKCGDKGRAQGYLKQLLTADPNDVDGWLVLAAILDDHEKKRQCLNRVLTIDPVNKIARQEMLKLDRAAFRDMSAPAQPPVVEAPKPRLEAVVQPVQPVQPSFPQTPTPSVTASPIAQPQPAGARLSKTLVFTYPLWMKILTYLVSAIFWFATIAMLCASPAAAVVSGIIAVASLASIWIISARVEVSNEGIMSSHLLSGGAKIAWNEIAEFKSGFTGQSLNLISKSGKKVSVTAQVGGYSEIIELLRRKRPDLFNGQPVSQDGTTPQKSTFSGEKTFKRNSATSVVGYGFGLLIFFVGLWGLFSNWGKSSGWVGGAIFLFFGLFLIGGNLLAIQELIVRPQQITIIKNFGEEQLTQNQVSEIKIKTVRGRGGRVTNFVVIQRASGGSITVSGLPGGTELIYGTLMNWWQGANS